MFEILLDEVKTKLVEIRFNGKLYPFDVETTDKLSFSLRELIRNDICCSLSKGHYYVGSLDLWGFESI